MQNYPDNQCKVNPTMATTTYDSESTIYTDHDDCVRELLKLIDVLEEKLSVVLKPESPEEKEPARDIGRAASNHKLWFSDSIYTIGRAKTKIQLILSRLDIE